MESLSHASTLLCVMGLTLVHVVRAQNTPKDFLDLHNAARSKVGVEPLKWDDTLEDYAQKYAIKRSTDCQHIHSGGPYGENIYWGYGDGYTDAAAAVNWWVNEKNYYDYDSNTCNAGPGQECLHYTQIVWRNTERLGCARVTCFNGNVFITCNYDPPGNYIGEKPY